MFMLDKKSVIFNLFNTHHNAADWSQYINTQFLSKPFLVLMAALHLICTALSINISEQTVHCWKEYIIDSAVWQKQGLIPLVSSFPDVTLHQSVWITDWNAWICNNKYFLFVPTGPSFPEPFILASGFWSIWDCKGCGTIIAIVLTLLFIDRFPVVTHL